MVILDTNDVKKANEESNTENVCYKTETSHRTYKYPQWPMNPNRISRHHVLAENDSDSYICKKHCAHCGIMTVDHIKDALARFICKFGMPFSIIERCDECNISSNNNDKYEIIKPNSENTTIMKVCETLKREELLVDDIAGKQTNEDAEPHDHLCMDVYEPIGDYFFISMSEHEKSTYRDKHGLQDIELFDLKDKSYRECISFVCKNTGFVKMAFPIKLNDKTIAVLQTGRKIIANESKEKKIPEVLGKKIDKLTQENRIYVEDALERYGYTDIESIKEILKEVCADIERFELRISGRFAIQRGDFLYKRQNELIKKLFRDMNDLEINFYDESASEQQLDWYWKCFADIFKEIVSLSSIHSVYLFGYMHLDVYPDETMMLTGIYVDDTYDKNSQTEKFTMNQNINIFSNDATFSEKVFSDASELKKLFIDADCPKLKIDFNDFKNQKLFLTDLSHKEPYGRAFPPLGVMVHYKDREEFERLESIKDNNHRNEKKYKLKELLQNLISVFSSKLLSNYSSYEKFKLEKIVSSSEHEVAQVEAGLSTTDVYFKNAIARVQQTINRGGLKPHEIEVFDSLVRQCIWYQKSVAAFRHTIKNQAKTIAVQHEINPNKINFYPWNEFLFKWKGLYDISFQDRYLVLEIPQITLSDPKRPMMYADPVRIEQVAYNLTNNAEKYSFFGSKIKLDCRLNDNEENYLLTITNYGHQIPESEYENIFKYGARLETGIGEGSGIGLYISKRIALAHGGSLTVKSKRVCDVNVCLMNAYLYAYRNNKLPSEELKDLYEVVVSERAKIDNGKMEEILSHEYNDKLIFTPMIPIRFIDELHLPTAETTFTLSIPHEKKKRRD